ncbi:hypothetical protein GQ600_22211 [Phytophthora cactorum]|nr:hypothetical protein GQ600_22211 [Phytophthora cactorum]
MSCMVFADAVTDKDPWKPIRPFADGFNERRKRVVPSVTSYISASSSRQVTNPCACEYGEGAAVVLRPAEPYKGTGRTMVTDSAFGSYKKKTSTSGSIRLHLVGRSQHFRVQQITTNKLCIVLADESQNQLYPTEERHCLELMPFGHVTVWFNEMG